MCVQYAIKCNEFLMLTCVKPCANECLTRAVMEYLLNSIHKFCQFLPHFIALLVFILNNSNKLKVEI